MLNHTPKERPSAIDAREKYRDFVEASKTVEIYKAFNCIQLMDERTFELWFGNKPVMKRSRIGRRSRFSRHRNVK